ncbi:hypothetical protein C7458_10631 [Williamsia muralis]|nr:hypothetical protein C7458_10631 [Williamsia marianensis]
MAIVPDTKNWTWVLERPCPDCGFDPSEIAFRGYPGTDQSQRRPMASGPGRL